MDCPRPPFGQGSVERQYVFERSIRLDLMAGSDNESAILAYTVDEVIDLLLDLRRFSRLKPALYIHSSVQHDLPVKLSLQLIRIHSIRLGLYRLQGIHSQLDESRNQFSTRSAAVMGYFGCVAVNQIKKLFLPVREEPIERCR